jgi:hypothetical protein
MKTPISKPRAENHPFTKTKSNTTKSALRTPQYRNPDFTNHEECHKEDPPLIDVLQNLLRRKTLGTYDYFMHVGAFENKADSPNPPSQTYTKHPEIFFFKKNRKTPGKNQDKTKTIKFARGEEKREKEVVELILRTKTISSRRRRRRRRGRWSSVYFYWPCRLQRQGYCVHINYRVYSSLRDFGPKV